MRQINQVYRIHYEHLMQSGLYQNLVDRHLLIPHKEIEENAILDLDHPFFIYPERIPFISYPYEWSFSQYRDAALNLLEIQKTAVKHGMWLKDASAFNMQWHRGHWLLIDTLSFELIRKDLPWPAYRQYCEHFLAPLLLMSRIDAGLNTTLQTYLEGIPLELATRLLPKKTFFKPGHFLHIALHAKAIKRLSEKNIAVNRKRTNQLQLEALTDSLQRTVSGISYNPAKTVWSDYSLKHSYSTQAVSRKSEIIEKWIMAIRPSSAWDLGSNTGNYSRLASRMGIFTVSLDMDPVTVEANYRRARQDKETSLLPLVMNLTRPSPAIGWANQERMNLAERGPVDLTLALALIHHLVIAANIPWARVAAWFSKLCSHLIIEFVPKEDSQIQRMLRVREDIFFDYNRNSFETAFKEAFEIIDIQSIEETGRLLYRMSKKSKSKS